MKPHKINDLNNFICGWYMRDTALCDLIISYHNNSNKKYSGISSDGSESRIKKSTDVVFEPDAATTFNEYILHLTEIFSLYMKSYPYANHDGNWGFLQNINIQHYAPGEGFYSWHSERSGPSEPSVSRHMVFMTYLNDVNDAGQTEFYHQKLSIKPEKGLTLMWPVDWTFTHRGIPSLTEHKYITTGWTNHIKK